MGCVHLVLPHLLPLVTSPDRCLRHGAVHAVAEIIHALCEVAIATDQTISQYLGEDTITALLQVAPRVSMLFTCAEC